MLFISCQPCESENCFIVFLLIIFVSVNLNYWVVTLQAKKIAEKNIAGNMLIFQVLMFFFNFA